MPNLQPVISTENIHEMARMAHTIWNEYFPPIIGQEQVDYMVEKFQSEAALSSQIKEGYEYYFICNDGDRLGYLGLVPRSDKNALQISKFYLLKEARGKGIARVVMHEALKMAKSKGFDHLYLTVNKYNEGAIAVYKKLGFTISGDIVMDIDGGFKMDDYELIKLVTD